MGKMTMKFKGGDTSFTVDAPSEAVAKMAMPDAEVVQEQDSTPDIIEVQVVEVVKEVEKIVEVVKEVEKLVYVPEIVERIVEKQVEVPVEKIVEKVVEKNVYIPTLVNRDIIRGVIPPYIYLIIASQSVAIVSLFCYILK